MTASNTQSSIPSSPWSVIYTCSNSENVKSTVQTHTECVLRKKSFPLQTQYGSGYEVIAM